jgi:hypothetical protein
MPLHLEKFYLRQGPRESSNGTEVHGHRQGTHEREQEEYKEVSRSSSEVCHKVENQIEHNGGPYKIVSLLCAGASIGNSSESHVPILFGRSVSMEAATILTGYSIRKNGEQFTNCFRKWMVEGIFRLLLNNSSLSVECQNL